MAWAQAFATTRYSAETMWRLVGSFQAIGQWHPLVAAVSGGESPGDLRTLQIQDGLHQSERLVLTDPQRHVYRYTVTSTDLPIRNCTCEFTVRRDGAHRSTIIWTAEFEVTSGDQRAAVAAVQTFFNIGVRNLENHYAPRHQVGRRI